MKEGIEVWQRSDASIHVAVPGFGGIGKVPSGIASLFGSFDIGELNIFPDTGNPRLDGRD